MAGQNDNLVGLRPPEFPLGCVWFNSAPLSIEELLKSRKIILVNFWAYSRADCLRGLPYIRQWHERYGSLGLAIIGVHSAEFEFEKNEQNVKLAVEYLGVGWPVVSDPNHAIWKSYTNAFWPRTLLINSKGFIVYDHIGVGSYEDIERVIQTEMTKLFLHNVSLPALVKDADVGSSYFPLVSEYYFGSIKGLLGNASNDKGLYEDDGDHKKNNVYLNGSWSIQPEYIQHARMAHVQEDYMVFDFSAFEVNGVFGSADQSEFEVEIQYNKKPLEQAVLGSDVIFNSEHKSVLKIKEPRMYNIIDSADILDGELKMFVVSDQFQAYTLTFAGSEENI